ncbi:NDP-hexose 2,3-dehydratase family protein [Streptomyces cyaneofuscatus]|uniref:NDP-hexose 2,3-dehydratase family protein n=1 Tax=Streptomyces cyaneofuscatus TaxID=66883 RepID=UPI0033B70A60
MRDHHGVSHAPQRLVASLLAEGGPMSGPDAFRRWWRTISTRAGAERRPLEELVGWHSTATGELKHDSGGFFSVEGLGVRSERGGPVEHWQQPIIHQPETGILGILVKEFDGVPYCLMQAKAEPGNRNGIQLSPTVQATRSNFSRVHGGAAVPYLDHFREPGARRVIVDVRQSEQGSWFYRKCNRNMVVEITGEVEVLDSFCWLSLGQLLRLLREEDLVNMDTRTVLSCLPLAAPGLHTLFPSRSDPYRAALVRSLSTDAPAPHPLAGVLSWITEARSTPRLRTRWEPLDELHGWHRADGRISHESGRFFDVIGVGVTAVGREVRQWTQPMIEPYGTGLIAFLTREADGVLQVLVRQRAEPGFLDVAELGPTVQCTPGNYDALPADARPALLDEVLRAAPDRIRYDVLLSEEGGRFFHALNRYVIVESDVDVPDDDPDFRWLTVHQLSALLAHSHYVNVQARTLLACLFSLSVS